MIDTCTFAYLEYNEACTRVLNRIPELIRDTVFCAHLMYKMKSTVARLFVSNNTNMFKKNIYKSFWFNKSWNLKTHYKFNEILLSCLNSILNLFQSFFICILQIIQMPCWKMLWITAHRIVLQSKQNCRVFILLKSL